jgi:hypothetical protein
MQGGGNSFSEDEISSDFTILYKEFVRRHKDYLGDFFINETKVIVNKLCDDFEKHIQTQTLKYSYRPHDLTNDL